MKRRFLSTLMALVLALSLIPTAALAVGEQGDAPDDAAGIDVLDTGDTTPEVSNEPEETPSITSGDAESLKAAIAAAANGTTIEIPAGTYDVGNAYYISNQVNLVGAGPGQTILNGTIFLTQTTGNMSISNMTFQGTGIHVALNIQGHSNDDTQVLNNATITVDNCTFQDYEYTIGLNTRTENCKLVVEDTEFIRCGCAVAIQAGKGNTVDFRNVTTNGSYAIQSFEYEGNTLKENSFYQEYTTYKTGGVADVNAITTPITFITSVKKDVNYADIFQSAADGAIIMFTGGEYNIGSLSVPHTVNIQGGGKDVTTLNGSISYNANGSGTAVSVSDITMAATEANSNHAINFGSLTSSTINVSDCSFEGYQFGIGVNSSATGNTLNIARTEFDDVWCALGIKYGNTLGTLDEIRTSDGCYAVQIFGRPDGEGYDYGAFYETVESYQQDPQLKNPDWAPEDGRWPTNYEAYTVDTDGTRNYGTLKELVEKVETGNSASIYMNGKVTLESGEYIKVAQGANIKVIGNGNTIEFMGGGVFNNWDGNEGLKTGTKLMVNGVHFKNNTGTSQGYAAVVGFNSFDTVVTMDGCIFEDMYCGVYVNPVSDAPVTGSSYPSISITDSTYINTTYGYSVDTVTDGAITSVDPPTFTGNKGISNDKISETWNTVVASVTSGNVTKVYKSWTAAMDAATTGDTVTLQKDINGPITISKDVTVVGNGNTVSANGTDTAITVDSNNVTLQEVNAESDHGIALVVNENKTAPTIIGGTYKTCTEPGGYNEDYGKQGEGAIRFNGNNGNVTVKDTTLTGGIHVLNYSNGALTITGNTIGFDYAGETAFVGIVVQGSANPTDVTVNGLVADNNISLPNEDSIYVQFANSNWESDNEDQITAKDSAAKIGTNYYLTLQDAVDSIATNGSATITLLKNINETVSVSRVVTFTINSGSYAFNGRVVAGNGFQVSVSANTYTVTTYTAPSNPGSSGSSSSTTYSPTLDVSDGGTIKVSPRTPEAGDKVTITPDPDNGYEVGEVTVTDRSGDAVRVTANRNGTYTFTQPRGRVTIQVTFVRAGESAFFDDVPASFWAYDEIAWAYDNGYVNGTSATTFSPNSSITRQQVWMILARLSGADPASMAAAREWAMANNISDGTNPGNAVTRQQLVALLYRYAQMMGYDNGAREALASFPDAGTVSGYAQEPMQWSVANNIVAGTSDGTLNPTGTATRAQFAVILYRFWDQVG